MKIMLGTFACFCIETRCGPDLGAGAQTALRHYAERLRSRRPVPIPRFLRERPAEGVRVELELTIEPEVREILELEASERKVRLEHLLSHAVFVYLADLDVAGRADDFWRGARRSAKPPLAL
jgi:hypothetical protein